MSSRVDNFLRHYASEYYDPAKAHEYYLRNRELKGLGPPATTTKSGKPVKSTAQAEALSYTRRQISEKRKADLTTASDSQKAALEKLRADAQATHDRIAGKLTDLVEKLKADALTVKVNEIPPNASPKLRAFLEGENAKLRSAASKSRAKTYAEARVAAADEMRKVGADVKAAIAAARDSYKASRDALVAKYDQAKVTEETNIRQNIK